MAKAKEKTETAAAETAAAKPAAPADDIAALEEEAMKKQKSSGGAGPLRVILTILLVLVGIGEVALWGYFGVGTVRNNIALRQYEARQRALEEERAARGTVGGSSYGPNLKVENGTVTWQREDWISAGTSQSAGGPAPVQEERPKRLSRLYVPRINYALAEMDTEDQIQSPGEDQTAGETGDGTTPTPT